MIEENKEGKMCSVVVSEEISGIAVSSYTVETLDGIIYEGKEPQNEYQAPCGNLGDMLCFTAKGDGADCEKEICILLDKLEGSKPESKIIADHDEPITVNCYPNPTKDVLFVSTNISSDATGQLLISNLYGIPIYRQKIGVGQSQQEIDTSTFGSGNYLLTVTDSKGGFAVQKFVILK